MKLKDRTDLLQIFLLYSCMNVKRMVSGFFSKSVNPLQSVLQRLESVTLSEAVSNHRAISDGMLPFFSGLTLENLEISFDALKGGRNGEWVYIPVRERPGYTLAVFSLPSGTKLPLHNHPDMSVLMKVLKGSLSVSSGRVARTHLEMPQTFGEIVLLQKPLETSLLTGESQAQKVEGIHEIVAIEDSVFIDLVTPPYGDDRCIKYFERIENDKLKIIEEPSYNRGISRKWNGL